MSGPCIVAVGDVRDYTPAVRLCSSQVNERGGTNEEIAEKFLYILDAVKGEPMYPVLPVVGADDAASRSRKRKIRAVDAEET
jgi:hypothetical protein